MKATLLLGVCLLFATLPALAQKTAGVNTGVAGQWREPGGSVIEIAPCGADLCAKLVALSPEGAGKLDGNNPDAALRKRSLCGLQIAYGFHLIDPTHADGGRLYDPKSGKTYHGTMTSEGDQLHLRGYVGIKAFGRTETWARTTAGASCAVKAAG